MPCRKEQAKLELEFLRDKDSSAGTGTIRLLVNGSLVGEGRITEPVGYRYASVLGIGRDYGSPVSQAFQPPYAFSGRLEKITVELK